MALVVVAANEEKLMPSKIIEPLMNEEVATGNNATQSGAQFLISGINPWPNDHLNQANVGNSFRVKDGNLFRTGVLLELVHPPGAGQQTATFCRPAADSSEEITS